VQSYVWPDLVIIGGGVSKKHDKFLPLLRLKTQVVPAQLRNEAGIIGAALAASRPRPTHEEKDSCQYHV
jgi:polyphosphate glucokinase